MINVRYRLVRNRLKLFQRRCVGATPLKSQPRPRQRRSQIVSDVIADAGERVDHRFHFIKHAIDDSGKIRKRIGDVAVRKPLTQIAGDDTLNSLIYLFDALLRPPAHPRPGQQAQAKCRQQPQRKRLTDDVGNLPGFVDLTSNHQGIAIWRSLSYRADHVGLWTGRQFPNNREILDGTINLELRQLFKVPRNLATIRGEQSSVVDPAGILSYLLVDRLQL